MSSNKTLYCLDPNSSPFTFTSYFTEFFVIPCNIGTYDGTTDPDEHLFVFTQIMGIHSNDQHQWAKCFPLTLRGKARIWFETLKPRSISSFDQLAKSFRTRFLHMVKLKHSTDDIVHMKPQRIHESFKDFLERFNEVILMTETGNRSIEDFEELVINIFINKLKPSPCLRDFKAKPPSTLEELQVRAHKLSRLEAGLGEQQGF